MFSLKFRFISFHVISFCFTFSKLSRQYHLIPFPKFDFKSIYAQICLSRGSFHYYNFLFVFYIACSYFFFVLCFHFYLVLLLLTDFASITSPTRVTIARITVDAVDALPPVHTGIRITFIDIYEKNNHW